MASKKFFIKKRNFLERDTLEIEAVGSLNQTHGTLRTPKRALTYISSPKSKLIFCLKTGLISTILVWVKNLILVEEFLIKATIFSVPAVVFWQSEESERSQNCWFSFFSNLPLTSTTDLICSSTPKIEILTFSYANAIENLSFSFVKSNTWFPKMKYSWVFCFNRTFKQFLSP